MKALDNDIIDSIRKIEDLDDGSSVYEIGEPEIKKGDIKNSFNDNLAVNFPEEALTMLSSYLLEAIDEDILSRKDWLDSVEKVKPFLGISLEDINEGTFTHASRTYDSTMLVALLRFYAITRAELLPPLGPAGFKISGPENDELIQHGERQRDWNNYYLTVVDQAYYPNFDRFLLYLGFYGSGFKKVYYDKLQKRAISRFILPEDFIVDSDCTSILESNRLTHVLHLSKREILLNQKNNIYRDVELVYLKSLEIDDSDEIEDNDPKDGIDLDVYTKRSLFPIYEIHTYLNLEEFKTGSINNDSDDNIPLPYIVTIDKITKKILSIQRNWEENDPEQKRIEYFVQYSYLPGFGIYSFGIAHIAGANSITCTKALRWLLDAAAFKNLPGGLRAKSVKNQDNNLIVGIGEFVEVDTGGIPLQQAFMPLPYSGADPILRELRREIIGDIKEAVSTSEMGMLESKEDIPTGTTLALLESNNRIQSAVLKSIHHSLSRELQLLNKIFSRTIISEKFNIEQRRQEITAEDFKDEVMIIPVSDPSINSTPQRIMKAMATMDVARQDPQAHDMHAVFRMVYKAQGLDEEEINKILKPPPKEAEIQPLDPVSENQNVLLGKPVKAAIWQFHDGHILSHGLFAEEYPETKPTMLAHIKEHQALKYQLQMQELLGQELPPLEEIQDPQVQNAIAMEISRGLEEFRQSSSEQQTIDPNALLMADIEQKAADTAAKERIANTRAETDIFKAQLEFEKEKAKIESNEDIAVLKAETELTKQEIQNNNYQQQGE